MSRYRPPAPRSSPYITRQGYQSLLDEQKSLWVRRRDVVAALSAAAAEGDRSENAEYIYRKKELRDMDRRIRYLQKRLPDLKVVEQSPAEQDRVFFAARVTLEDEAGETKEIRIVGADELDLDPINISVDSPMAQALLKQELDSEVGVQKPDGMQTYVIIDIRYGY